MSEFIADVVCFQADDEVVRTSVIAEVTDFTKSGKAEIAFNVNGLLEDGQVRIYVSIPLPEMISKGMALVGSSG